MRSQRLDAVLELLLPEAREQAGLHEFDGRVQDLSPAGVSSLLGSLGKGPTEPDPHDEAHLAAFEAGLRATYGLVEMHRWNPLVHLANLDLSPYDREYAPAELRDAARLAHLAAWPDAIAGAVASLDRVPSRVARALRPAAAGLGIGLDRFAVDSASTGAIGRATEALAVLLAHLDAAAGTASPDAPLGAKSLAVLLGAPEALPVDLDRLDRTAALERDRLAAILTEACGRLAPKEPTERVVRALLDEPRGMDEVYASARELVGQLTDFVERHGLLPALGGSCLIGPAPASRRWAMAMMSWNAPEEAEAPAWYHINPPDPSFGPEEARQWLAVFSATTLPAITAHEVMPGHFAHGQMLRSRARGPVRRSLCSAAFVEGWAHYGEELLVEEGFMAENPRYVIGVAIEALVRVTRLRVALGVHAGGMTLAEAAALFEADAYLLGPAGYAEAERALFDPTYGRYTWGKLEIAQLRDEAIVAWGTKYSHRRFHESLLSLGAPPLGLIGDALEVAVTKSSPS